VASGEGHRLSREDPFISRRGETQGVVDDSFSLERKSGGSVSGKEKESRTLTVVTGRKKMES